MGGKVIFEGSKTKSEIKEEREEECELITRS